MDHPPEGLSSVLHELERVARQLLQDPRILHTPKPPGVESDATTRSSIDEAAPLYKLPSSLEGPQIGEKLDLGPVKLLKTLFGKTWQGERRPGVPYQIFSDNIAHILLPNAAPSVLKGVVCRIDSNANGTIDWEEVSPYLLMDHQSHETHEASLVPLYTESAAQSREARAMSHNHSLYAHKDSIHRMMMVGDRYFTASLDASIKMWSASNMSYLGTLHGNTAAARSRYISEMVNLPLSGRIAVFQIDRTVTLYDGASYNVHRLYQGLDTGGIVRKAERFRDIVNFDAGSSGRVGMTQNTKKIEVLPMEGLVHSPMCAAAATPSMQRKLFPGLSEPVFIGMELGYVQLFNFGKENGRESDHALKTLFQWRPHQSWVLGVRVCTRLDALVTMCIDQTLKIFNLEKAEDMQMLSPATVPSVDFSLLGFDYSEDLNMIATWGASSVCLWNPTLSNPTKLRLKNPVAEVRFDADNGQAVVLTEGMPNHICFKKTPSSDKVVTIFDVRSSKALQQISVKPSICSDARFTSIEVDAKRHSIIVGASTPQRLLSSTSDDHDTGGAIVAVLVNSTCDQIITADQHTVTVYDLHTGCRVAAWLAPKAISWLCFDQQQRRLILSFSGGSLAIFNTMNGDVLKKCGNTTGTSFDLSCLQHIEPTTQDREALIVGAGWSSRILLWGDVSGEFYADVKQEFTFQPSLGHVYSLSHFAPNRLAVGTSSGAVVVYDLGTPGTSFAVLKMAGITRRVSDPPEGNEDTEISFAVFKRKTQAGLSNIVEQVAVLSPTLLCTLHGSALVVVWRCAKRDAAEPIAAFPASYTPGDEAYVMDVALEKELLIVGDASGCVSTFSLAGVVGNNTAPRKCDDAPHDEMQDRNSTKERRIRRKDKEDTTPTAESAISSACTLNVRTVSCFRLDPSVITSLSWVTDAELLIILHSDKNPRIVTLCGVELATLSKPAGFPLPPPGSSGREGEGKVQLPSAEHQWSCRVRLMQKEHPRTGDSLQGVRGSEEKTEVVIVSSSPAVVATSGRGSTAFSGSSSRPHFVPPTHVRPRVPLHGGRAAVPPSSPRMLDPGGSPKEGRTMSGRVKAPVRPERERERPLTARGVDGGGVRRPTTARPPQTARPEVQGLLAREGGGGGGVSPTESMSPSHPAGPVDLSVCRRVQARPKSCRSDFTPRGLAMLRPPTFLAPDTAQERVAHEMAVVEKGLSPPKEMLEEVEEVPRFFSQYKDIMTQNEQNEERLAKLVQSSHAMQATRCAKNGGAGADGAGGGGGGGAGGVVSTTKSPLSYTHLLTSPLASVQTAKPYSDSHKNKRKPTDPSQEVVKTLP